MSTIAPPLKPSSGLSFAAGHKFIPPSDHPAILAEALVRAAHRHPSNGVIYLDAGEKTETQTYPELLREAGAIAAGLQARGLTSGQKVIFQLESNREFIPAFWACMLGGYIPVPVSISPTYEQPHGVLNKLRNCWEKLGHPLVITNASLLTRLGAFAEREGLDRFEVVSVSSLRLTGSEEIWPPGSGENVALMLLTSGSTGVPKLVQQTHRNLLAWGESANQACEFDHRDISINWMPLDHVGGLVMFHLRDVISGCTQIHAPTEALLRRPLLWLDWIEQHRATITWAPNFAYGLINDLADEIAASRRDLSTLRFILNGGEAIVPRTARRFLQILSPHGLPPKAMRPAWGMSETSSGVTYSRRFTLESTQDDDAFVEVGEPIPGIEIRIVDQSDLPVAEGKTGRLQIRGISVTPGYYENPEADEKSFTSDGWFITGDLGQLVAGQLAITGREKDVIIINGVNFYNHEIEASVEEIAGIERSFTAVCAVHKPGDNADCLAVFFCPEAESKTPIRELVQKVRSTVAQQEGIAPDFIIPLRPSDIPKTAIGKIQRAHLQERFERGDFSQIIARQDSAPEVSQLFERTWEASSRAVPHALPQGSRILVFRDPDGLADRLVTRWREEGHTCVVGSDQADVMPPQPFTHVLHTSGYKREAGHPGIGSWRSAQERGSLALLRALRNWTPPSEGTAVVKLLVVGRGIVSVAKTDYIDYSFGPVVGLVRTVPHELNWIRATVLDLEGSAIEEHVDTVAAELASEGDETEIAIRAGKRLVPKLQGVSNRVEDASDHGFVRGGFYLISGGLGGVGQKLARYLSDRYEAKLLLIGRSPLEGNAMTDGRERRSEVFQTLRRTGAMVHYAHGDIADAAFVQAAVEERAQHWEQPLAGILHLAGSYHEATLQDETDAGWLDILQSKLGGASALHQLTQVYQGCWFVHFSSLLGYFGAHGTGAYAAANASLDAFAQFQRSVGVRSQSVLWPLWIDTGMGRMGSTEAMAARGWKAFTPEQACALLEKAIQVDTAQILVGLDPDSRILRRYFRAGATSISAGEHALYLGPQTETEERLVQIWAELLRVPRVGITDNFFELGGKSLMAARIFARIQKEFGISLPLATLFKAPTIRQLAVLLSKPEKSASSLTYIQAIQTGGKRPPFFCIPGGGLDVLVFRGLVELLGKDQPFYGLQAHGLDGTESGAPYVSLEELAGDFIQQMQTVQAKGPYQIGGHCFGALLAYEMARQLRAKGERVSLLALIDPTAGRTFETGLFQSFKSRLFYHIKKHLRKNPIDQLKFLCAYVRYFFETKLVANHRLQHTLQRATHLHRSYNFPDYAGRMAIFLAEDSRHTADAARDPRRLWAELATDGAEIYVLPGNHHTMLHEKEVRFLAEALDPLLTKIEAAAPAESHR